MKWLLVPILCFGGPSVIVSGELPQSPGSMQTVLTNMVKAAKALAKDRKELRKEAQTIDFGAEWLKERLHEDDPVEYRLQLTIDGYLLDRAQANPNDAPGIMRSVAEDVDLKAKDCYKFGHGRRVPVEIRTIKGGIEDSGWEIHYRWLPPNNLPIQIAEMSFPNPSSPSNWELPVGMYEIYVEKTIASGAVLKSAPVVIPVGLESKGAWQLQIP